MKYMEDLLEELKKLIVSRLDGIEKKLDRLGKIKDAMEGDKLLDNQDMCLLLGITKRSLSGIMERCPIPKQAGKYITGRKTCKKPLQLLTP